MNFPQKFGKYLLVERIAVGGMAEIFKARTTGLGGFEKVLAIKRLHARHCEDGDLIKMLIDEAKIAVQLTHSNIVQVFDLDRLGDHYFICMEYIDGRDLHRIVRRRLDLASPFPIDVACFIAREVSNGLDYAHRRMAQDGTPLGIIHRDVSPQNVLISWAGEVKIIDFGIAKAARRAYETEAGIIKGKFCYMSPEQARGGQVDHRSDVFSLGICLHEMLTGDLLYQDDGDDSLLTKVRRAQITPPGNIRRDIPASLDRIVMKALARDPYDRFQSAAALGDALARFLHSAHPHTGRATVAAFMHETYGSAPPDAVPVANEDDTIMSRVDYQADGSSLIYDVVRGMPANGRGASGRAAAFDDDPFFTDAEEMYGKHDRKDQRPTSDDEVIEIHSEEISVLDEGDIEIVGGEVTPAGAYRPGASSSGDYGSDYDPMDDEPTKVRRSPYLSEPSMPSAAAPMDPSQPHPHHLEATFEEQPTQVYNKPQAILAASPDADHGPLGGVARLEDRATDATGAPLSEEPTVITAMDDVRPDHGRAEPMDLSGLPPASGVREPTDPHGIAAPSAPVPAVGGVQLSPMLVVSLFLLVLVLGGVLVLAIQLVVGGEEEPAESIAQPTTPTEIPAPAAGATSPTAAAIETSSYYITSHPDGARVILDGRFVDSTPTTLSNLEIGRTYHLRLEKEGFEPHDQELTPAAGGTQSLALNLDPLLANLLVDTIPSGAEIYLDGVYREDSPTVIRGLDVRNTYVLSASMDGFLTQNQRIDWPEGTRSDRQVTLRLVPVEGGAVVDAVAMRTESSDDEEEARSARHVSSSRDDDEREDDSSQRARSSREREREAEAEREARRERTERRQDRDEEDEERSARSSRDRDRDEEDDDRSSRRHRDRDDDERASASRDEEREASASSEGAVGRISVQAVPAGQVFVDGELVATETPLMNHELEAGTHRVKVYFISLRRFSEERRVRVVEGEGRSVVFRSRD
jgi:hypothetical protein